MKNYFLSLGIILCVFMPAYSQLNVSGQLRPRAEYSHGFASLADESQEASFFTSQRTRINVAYHTEYLQTKIVLQDVRLWGDKAQLSGNDNYAISIHEAWAKTSLLGKFSLKAGRMELVYDDARILGNVAWAQQGRSHDLALLKYKGDFEAHLGLAFYQNMNRTNSFFDGANAYKAMQFLWLNQKIGKFQASLLVLNNGLPFNESNAQRTIYSQTVGTHINFVGSSTLSILANAYYQRGEVIFGGNPTSLSAYNILIEAKLKSGNFTFTGGYELLSGNDISSTEKVQAFNPLYGTNHKFNGFMDYFYVGNHINSAGLHNAYLKASHTKNAHSMSADLHLFAAHRDFASQGAGLLGVEADFTYSYSFPGNTLLTLGYSHLFADEKMEALKGGKHDEIQNWGYVMFTFNF